MPSFISICGKQYPAKEIAHGIYNRTGKTLEHEWIIGPDGSHKVEPGDQFTYNGPDREALKVLAEANEEFLGKDFRTDPDFLQSVRNMNYNSVDEYLKSIGFDYDKEVKQQEEMAASIVTKHSLPKKVKEIKVMSGGRSTEGDFIGGFGSEKLRDSKELKDTKEPVKTGK